MRRVASVWRGLFLAGIAAASAVVGCISPYPNVLVTDTGQQIRLSDIDAILADTALDEDEKKQALRDLGITDEELLNVLVTRA